MKSRMRLPGSAAILLLLAVAAQAQTTPPAPPVTPAAPPAPTVETGGKEGLIIRGFISASLYAQDQSFAFGNGQNAEWPTPPQLVRDKWITSGDVRNTRLTLAFNGPKVSGDWRVAGTVEMDFFGGNNGTGAFADQQVIPRLRFAYADVTNGRTTIRVGQFWSPLFGNVPVSNSHIAFPLGYGSGMPGWRYPGLFVYQALTPKSAPVNAEVQLAVMRGNWDNTPGSNVNSVSAGNSGTPQFEARFNLGGKAGGGTWGIYVVGHYDEKDLSGPNATAANDKLEGTIGEFGARFQLGGLLIHGNVYTAKNSGQQFTSITQFGKIKSTGGWIQVGYDFTKNWGVFCFYAIDDPNDSDVLTALGNAGRLKNQIYSDMLRWRTGPYSLGLEWLHAELISGTARVKTKGNQIALSALYNF
ncbi:MAG: hypothetical protein ABI592_04645 [Acidobacteriota bacterium]